MSHTSDSESWCSSSHLRHWSMVRATNVLTVYGLCCPPNVRRSPAAALGVVLDWRPLLAEPDLRLGFRDDREDLDLRFCNVIEHPDVAHAKTVLGLAQTAQPLDPALADFRRFMGEVLFKRRPHPGP